MEKLGDVILHKDDGYNSFPSIARDADGTLYLVFRHAPSREGVTHVDSDSIAWLMKSADDGKSWTKPAPFFQPRGFGMQDPCIKVLKNGNILITSFFWKFLNPGDAHLADSVLKPRTLKRKLEDGRIAYSEGTYAFISTDKGASFAGPYCIERGYSMRGQCAELDDGTLLAPMYDYYYGEGISRVVLYSSMDGGVTWGPYAYVWHDASGRLNGQEPTLIQSPSGDLYCFIRTEQYMLYCKSTNRGKTWTQGFHTDILNWVPCDVLRLSDDRMLLTYGRRQPPYGIRALLLDENMHGIGSEREFVLRDDGLGSDISYNSAVQLPDGRVLAVYYFYTGEDNERRHIAGTWLKV